MLLSKLIRNLIICCCLILWAGNVRAQQTIIEIDSLVETADRINNADDAIELGSRAYINSKAIGYVEGMIKGMIVTSVKAFDVGRYEAVLKSLNKIQDYAVKLRDNTYLAHIYMLQGDSYSKLGFYDEADVALNLAKSYAEKIKDEDKRHYRLGNVYTGLGLNSEAKGDRGDSSLTYLRKSYVESGLVRSKIKFRQGFIISTNNLGAYYLDVKKHDSAEHYLSKALIMARGESMNALLNCITLETFGALYFDKKEYGKSLNYYNQALAIANEIKNSDRKKAIYLGLSKTYEGLGDYLKAQAFLKRHVYVTDSLSKADKKAVSIPLKNIIKLRDDDYKNKKNQYLFGLFLVITMLGIAVWGAWTLYKMFKKEQITNAEQADLLEEKMNGIDYHLAKEKTDLDELKTVVQLAIANDAAFFVKFNELDPEFIKKLLLLSPKLVAGELEFCALLRLNFETKEIARYTGMSVRAVEGKKYRVRKKLNISSEEDLNIWMTNL